MGFFSGRITFARYRVNGRAPRQFGPEHLEQLAAHAIGKQRVAIGDGTEIGWTAGDHVLDTRFELEKNIVDDTLNFALRVDEVKLPAELLRAYFQVELEALAASNPSGRPSNKQKREARDAAREKLEDEARDGRFLKRKTYPLMWDARANELLVGTTAQTVIDRLHTLFQGTFGHGFELQGAGRLAYLLAEAREQTRGVDDATPSGFVPSATPATYCWVPDETGRDFLGNEFFLWLWYQLDCESDTLTLTDRSEVALLLSRTLTLECPRGQTGKESISSDGPTRLPEARRAIQAGKLPRKVGLTMVRHDQSYEMTWQAESLAVSGARLPAPEAVEERARLEERVAQLRHLRETLDLLYDTFGKIRHGDAWAKELGRMQKWLQREERAAA